MFGAYWPQASVDFRNAVAIPVRKESEPPHHVLVSSVELQTLVRSAAYHLRHRFQGQPLTLCGVLTGSFMFVADLARELALTGFDDLNIRFVGTQSYGNGETHQDIRLTLWFGNEAVLTGRHLVYIEDIVDTGRTLQFLFDQTLARRFDQPQSLSAVALLNKPSRREVDLAFPLWTALDIPNRFAKGYGLDGSGIGRQQPYIYYN